MKFVSKVNDPIGMVAIVMQTHITQMQVIYVDNFFFVTLLRWNTGCTMLEYLSIFMADKMAIEKPADVKKTLKKM
jgi:hypothetical protein